jgi:hypothetical protein
MNLLPLGGFYWRRSKDIEKLVSSGHSTDGSSHFILDVLNANAPLLKKYYPAINENGLLDDAMEILKEVLAPPAPVPTSSDIQQTPGQA